MAEDFENTLNDMSNNIDNNNSNTSNNNNIDNNNNEKSIGAHLTMVASRIPVTKEEKRKLLLTVRKIFAKHLQNTSWRDRKKCVILLPFQDTSDFEKTRPPVLKPNTFVLSVWKCIEEDGGIPEIKEEAKWSGMWFKTFYTLYVNIDCTLVEDASLKGEYITFLDENKSVTCLHYEKLSLRQMYQCKIKESIPRNEEKLSLLKEISDYISTTVHPERSRAHVGQIDSRDIEIQNTEIKLFPESKAFQLFSFLRRQKLEIQVVLADGEYKFLVEWNFDFDPEYNFQSPEVDTIAVESVEHNKSTLKKFLYKPVLRDNFLYDVVMTEKTRRKPSPEYFANLSKVIQSYMKRASPNHYCFPIDKSEIVPEIEYISSNKLANGSKLWHIQQCLERKPSKLRAYVRTVNTGMIFAYNEYWFCVDYSQAVTHKDTSFAI